MGGMVFVFSIVDISVAVVVVVVVVVVEVTGFAFLHLSLTSKRSVYDRISPKIITSSTGTTKIVTAIMGQSK